MPPAARQDPAKVAMRNRNPWKLRHQIPKDLRCEGSVILLIQLNRLPDDIQDARGLIL